MNYFLAIFAYFWGLQCPIFLFFLPVLLLDTLIYYLLLFLFKYAHSQKTFFLALKTFVFEN